MIITAFAWWYRAVPARVGRNARPARFADGVLTVHTRTTVWADQLQYLHDQLMASLKAHAPRIPIRELRFRVGKLPPYLGPAEPPLSVDRSLTQLPDTIARALARISDDSLREAIGRAAAASLEAQASTPCRDTGTLCREFDPGFSADPRRG